jgi:hypothetical protein
MCGAPLAPGAEIFRSIISGRPNRKPFAFEELLAKLKALHKFLSTNPNEPEEDLSDQFADPL